MEAHRHTLWQVHGGDRPPRVWASSKSSWPSSRGRGASRPMRTRHLRTRRRVRHRTPSRRGSAGRDRSEATVLDPSRSPVYTAEPTTQRRRRRETHPRCRRWWAKRWPTHQSPLMRETPAPDRRGILVTAPVARLMVQRSSEGRCHRRTRRSCDQTSVSSAPRPTPVPQRLSPGVPE